MKSRGELYAEGLREVGILVLVFGPISMTFETEKSGWNLAQGLLVWFLGGLIVFALGTEIERRRK